MPNFDFGQNPVPTANSKPYNPGDYNLPVWRDEDHLPPQETVTAERKTQTQTADSMTVEAAKNKLCAWAMSQIGYHEGPDNQTKYAENVDLQRMYGWKPQNQPWCDVFVDSGFISCFGLAAACAMTYQPMGAGSALCRQSAQYYKEHGAFYQRPEIGDQAFFYASCDINHTGIVVRIDGGSVHTVEGNSSDMVAERVYSTNDSKIAGYGRPNWAVVVGKDIDAHTNGVPDINAVDKPDNTRYFELTFPYIQRGDMNSFVMTIQRLLIANKISCGIDGADGDFGAMTEQAVREYQSNVGLSPDGIVGPDTAAKLFGVELRKAPKPETKAEEPKADSFWNNLLAKIKK